MNIVYKFGSASLVLKLLNFLQYKLLPIKLIK